MKQILMLRLRGGFRRSVRSLFVFTLLFLFTHSSHASSLDKFHQISMATMIEISLMGDDEEQANKAAFQAFQEIRRIEHLMSPWVESSDVIRYHSGNS
jgi:thiamine biosynthesis lipoprotein ApbE